MPWSDNSDNGSKPGPKPGPWGGPPPPTNANDGDAPRRPNGGAPRRPPPPEDFGVLLRRLRQQLIEMFGGQAGRDASPRLIAGVVGALLALWVCSGLYNVQPAEQAVVTTFGAYSRSEGPGLHYHLPAPVERVEKVSTAALNRVDIGGGPAGDAPQESLMLTGDENIVDLNFTVQWRINSASNYLFRVKDPDDAVKAVAESAMREVVGKSRLQAILTNGRGQVQDETQALMQRILDNYGAGIDVVEVQIRSANPPREVIPDFQAVASASQAAQSAVNDANAYRNRVVNEAKGDASKIVQSAQGYREQVVRDAEGDASRFSQIDAEYRRAPAVTRERLYLETMQRVLAKSNKVVIDAKGSTAPIILPPDVFRPRNADTPASAPPEAVAAPPPQPAPATSAGAGQ
jgi:membrane protease subunit HflK